MLARLQFRDSSTELDYFSTPFFSRRGVLLAVKVTYAKVDYGGVHELQSGAFNTLSLTKLVQSLQRVLPHFLHLKP